MITGEQVRAARELLGWDIAELATKAKIASTKVIFLETGGNVEYELRRLIYQILEREGVEFPIGEQPRFKLDL